MDNTGLYICVVLAMISTLFFICVAGNIIAKHRQEMRRLALQRQELEAFAEVAAGSQSALLTSIAALAMQKSLVLYQNPKTGRIELSALNTHSVEELQEFLDRAAQQLTKDKQ